MTVNKIYGLVAILLGAVVCFLAFTAIAKNNIELELIVFTFSLLIAAPALAGYTRLGLNYDSSLNSPTPPEVMKRRQIVHTALPRLAKTQTAFILAIPISLAIAFCFPCFSPWMIIGGIVVIAGGTWMLFGYEKAKTALKK